jgi:uncharacterized protein YceK
MSYLRVTLVVLCVATMLSGCASPQVRTQRAAERAERAAAAQAALDAKDDADCTRYGFKKPSDAFSACRLQIAQTRQANQAIADAAETQASAARAAANAAPSSCTSTGVGNTITTNCY